MENHQKRVGNGRVLRGIGAYFSIAGALTALFSSLGFIEVDGNEDTIISIALILMLIGIIMFGIGTRINKIWKKQNNMEGNMATPENHCKLNSGRVLKGVGITFVLIYGGMGISFVKADPEPNSIAALIFIVAIGISTFGIGVKKNRLWRRFPSYEKWVEESREGSIFELTRIMGISEKQVIKELEFLMKKGLFPDCSIDYDRKVFITPYKGNHQSEVPKQEKPTTYVCKACGGVNKDKHNSGAECDYCGASLS